MKGYCNLFFKLLKHGHFWINLRFCLVWVELRKSKALSSLNFLQRHEKYQIGSMKRILGISKAIIKGYWVPLLYIWQFECSVHIFRGPCMSAKLTAFEELFSLGVMASNSLSRNLMLDLSCNIFLRISKSSAFCSIVNSSPDRKPSFKGQEISKSNCGVFNFPKNEFSWFLP